MAFYLQPHKHNALALAASFIYRTAKPLIRALGPQQDNIFHASPVISVLNAVIDAGAAVDDATNKYANISITDHYWMDRRRLVKGNDA